MQIAGERLQHLSQGAVVRPLLKSPVTRLIRRIPRRQVLPGRTGAEDPQDAVEDIARIAPWPPAPVAPQPRFREERFENRPLRVSQVHTLRYDGSQDFVHTPAVGFMR